MTRAFRPASFRLQGLVTLLTVSSLRFRVGFVSHRRRSWDSPFEAFSFRKVSVCFHNRMHPPAIFFMVRTAFAAWTHEPRLLGFDPFGSPWQKTCS
jgi:hypothetical protein